MIPRIPHITAMGNPYLSSFMAKFNLLPKISKEPIKKITIMLIKIESEKI